ncbi:hypothetical protein OCV58_08420 [Megasphaera butyrica]|uniref:hypothetical protein n=1 Tax=Megasphaera butyrica TaxID=2981791 RepID=UPI0008224200|nr:hypothetical protein [Megasphaera butyrica]MCU6714932.1 hypothetical protein [Megasphaera butyrica]SCH84408.1 Uncharacterised protein [uncultured Megasphaera sp.]SCJ42860.1 Uncharacterised protein [uncultured Ruminococcus sp.]
MISLQELEEMRERDNAHKQEALNLLTVALTFDEKFFKFQLINDGNTVKITEAGNDEENNFLLCNVAGDNLPAMLYDVLKQGRAWLF